MLFNLTLRTTLIILTIVFISTLIINCLFLSFIFYKKNKIKSIKHKKLSVIATICAITLTFLSGIELLDLKQDINNYSVKYYSGYLDMSVHDFTDKIKKTWLAKTPKPNQKGILVVVYKFGCPDCESVYEPINRTLPHNNKNIYYVSSQSPYGKKLVKKAGLTNVPSLVYITKHDKKQPYYSTSLIYNRELDMNTVRYYLSLANSNI